ncbi:MAG: Asp-tRNA(Asn)/Glu-tRNA(Gln) amidotransferase subunit GatC [Desulfosudaceae bacterium]
MKITAADIQHVARLARLEVEDNDLAMFAEQIGDILGYVDMINQVTTESISPTAHAVSLVNAFREDEPGERSGNKDSLANAPAEEAGLFEVPRVID